MVPGVVEQATDGRDDGIGASLDELRGAPAAMPSRRSVVARNTSTGQLSAGASP